MKCIKANKKMKHTSRFRKDASGKAEEPSLETYSERNILTIRLINVNRT
jgi:hypothetical protein